MGEIKKYKGFKPVWEETPPPAGSFRSLFKWGNPEGFKEPNERLYKLMKETFHLTDEDFKGKNDIGLEPVPEGEHPVNLPQSHIDFFVELLGTDNVKTDTYSRLSVAYGKTMYDAYRMRQGIIENLPDLVLYPDSRAEIEAIVAYCSEKKIPLTVYGGGSSVTRGVEPVKGGISLDMRPRFNKVVSFNETDQTITVEAGMSGPKLEETLNDAVKLFGAKRAYTCGHFPQSFEYSSVGGWVVTRGAGQNSTYYGNIKDMVLGQSYATPPGHHRKLRPTRPCCGARYRRGDDGGRRGLRCIDPCDTEVFPVHA
jgi:alkyldihydroxyacetonephosphate synthase